MFNAFNVRNELVFFFNGLKSNGLENLTDQRITEVTFGVTINVLRLTEFTFKSNDAQLCLYSV